MFARRHPYLFFIMSLSITFSLFMVMIMGIIVGGAGLFNAGLAGIDRGNAGNVGIVEITGTILSSKEIIENIKAFREDQKHQSHCGAN